MISTQRQICARYGLWVQHTLTLLRRSCAMGDKVACKWHKVSKLKKRKPSRYYSWILPIYTKACDRGEALACLALVDLPNSGPGIPSDIKKHRHIWLQRACERKAPNGCRRLGQWFEARRDRRGLKAFWQGCKLADTESCIQLAQWLTRDTDPQKYARRRKALSMACRWHDQRACDMQQRIAVTSHPSSAPRQPTK